MSEKEINIQEAVKEFREILEKGDQDSAEVKEKLAKIEKDLDAHEEKNAQVTADLMEAKKREQEMKETVDALEAKLLRLPSGGSGYKEVSEELKAFDSFIAKGRVQLSPEELKYLRTDVDTAGGYLAPEEYVADIIKQITEISPIRTIARVRRTSSKSVLIPTRTGLVTGGWTGEGATQAASNSTYGQTEIPVNKLTAVVQLTNEMLADAAFNMESEVNQDIAETFANLEGTAFVSGNGVKKPEGFTVNASILASNVDNSGVANDITADAFITTSGNLKQGYTGVYVLNRKTLARVRKLKDGNGQYLWQNGLAAGLPNTINGESYVSAIDMPDIAANAYPVAYGDFMRGYTIVDHTDMAMVRDDYTLQDSGKVRIIAHRRVGGQVVLPEAIRLIKCSV